MALGMGLEYQDRRRRSSLLLQQIQSTQQELLQVQRTSPQGLSVEIHRENHRSPVKSDLSEIPHIDPVAATAEGFVAP